MSRSAAKREAIAVVNALVRAHNLIARKGGWTRRVYKVAGKECFCADGALLAACGADIDGGVMSLGSSSEHWYAWASAIGRLAEIIREPHGVTVHGLSLTDTRNGIHFFNDDSKSKANVLAAFKGAIAAARKAVPRV